MSSPAIGYTIKQAQGLFFDRAAVEDPAERATKRNLSKIGAFVRRTARSSIRKRKNVSQPGMPPTNRTGLVKQFIFFVYEPNQQNVVIGPARINRGDPDALEMLEHGGQTKRRILIVTRTDGTVDSAGNLRNARGRFVGEATRVVFSAKAKPRRVKYKARPFMGPALEKETTNPKLAASFKDSIR